MKPIARAGVALAIALVGIAIAFALIKSKPKAELKKRVTAVPPVEVVTVAAAPYTVAVVSQGEVLPRRSTKIAAEVTGSVLSVSDKFEVGQRFAEGEVLFEIDDADYRLAKAGLAADLAAAAQTELQEAALAAQALRDWKAIGAGGEPSDLVLRKPQLAAAAARVAAAKAGLEKAQRDLDRTVVSAPYPCQIKAALTELGAFVAPGTPVAEVFSTGGYEVRLPVALDDYSFVDLGAEDVPVHLFAEVAGEKLSWAGKLVRTEGQVERASRSVFLVAEVSIADGPAEAGRFLTPGLFLKASVTGRTLPDVYRLPRKALYGNSRVLVIGPDDTASFRRVKVLRTEADEVVIGGGLDDGERVAVSPLSQVIDGMKVKVQKQEGVGDNNPQEPKTGT